MRLSGRGKIDSSSAEARVRRILKLRSSRHRIFGSSLFGEPAWDILLALYLNTLSGRTESIAAYCLVSAVPSSTALRWIDHLEEEGWVRRQRDEADDQRCLIELTSKAEDALQTFFAQPDFADV